MPPAPSLTGMQIVPPYTPAPVPGEDDRDYPGRRPVIAAVALVSFMAAADTSMVMVALPALAGFFGAGYGGAAWVLLAYLLVVTVLLVPAGRLGDARGQKTVCLSGAGLFTLGALLCGLAPDLFVLLLCRALQGAGTALFAATSASLVAQQFPRKERSLTHRTLSVANGVGIAAGFLLGGIVLSFLPWQAIFFISVLPGTIACLLIRRHIPADTPQVPAPAVLYDLPGACLLMTAAGLSAFMLVPPAGGSPGSLPGPATIIPVVLLWVAFIAWELRYPAPLTGIHRVTGRDARLAAGAGISYRIALSGMTLLLPVFLLAAGYSPLLAGTILFVPALLVLAAGPAAGILMYRWGARPLCIAAGLLLAAALALLSLAGIWLFPAIVITALALRAVSSGLFIPPNMRLVLAATSREHRGTASGTWYFSSYLATFAGTAAAAAILVVLIPGVPAVAAWSGAGLPVTADAFRPVFAAMIVPVAVALLLTAVAREWHNPARPGPAAG